MTLETQQLEPKKQNSKTKHMSTTTAVQCDIIASQTMPTEITEEDHEESPENTTIALTPSQENVNGDTL